MAFGTLRWLIACAYGIPAGRAQQEIVGGPRWLDADYFDIIATVTSDDLRGQPRDPRLQGAVVQHLLHVEGADEDEREEAAAQQQPGRVRAGERA